MPGGFGLFSSRGGVGGGASLPDGVVGAFSTVDACVAALQAGSTGDVAYLIGQATGEMAAEYRRWPVDSDPANDVIETAYLDFRQCDGSEFTSGADDTNNFRLTSGEILGWDTTRGFTFTTLDMAINCLAIIERGNNEWSRLGAEMSANSTTPVANDIVILGLDVASSDATNRAYGYASAQRTSNSRWISSASFSGGKPGSQLGLRNFAGGPIAGTFRPQAHVAPWDGGGNVTLYRGFFVPRSGNGATALSSSVVYTGAFGTAEHYGARRPYIYASREPGSDSLYGCASVRWEPYVPTYPLEAGP